MAYYEASERSFNMLKRSALVFILAVLCRGGTVYRECMDAQERVCRGYTVYCTQYVYVQDER